MAQKFSLYGNLTVAQNQFFSGVYGLSGKAQRDKIDEMSRAFNFAPIRSDAGRAAARLQTAPALACARCTNRISCSSTNRLPASIR